MLRCRRSLGERRSDDLAESAHGAVTARSRANADARLVAAHEFFRKGEANAECWSMLIAKGRNWESAYRGRWRHDKVVRSTHGVNCTGSCSWNVLDGASGNPAVPNGSVGFRYGDAGAGSWNLRRCDLDPVLTLHGRHEQAVEVTLPRFDAGDGPGGATMRRGVPAVRGAGGL
jgi:nitrate reductase alpha subunit